MCEIPKSATSDIGGQKRPKAGSASRLLGVLSLVLVASLVGVAIGEVLLRLLPAGDRDALVEQARLPMYRSDPRLGYTLRSFFRGSARLTYRDVAIRTDAWGHRIRIEDRRDSQKGATLVFAGDSFAFGLDVQAEETFVSLVADRLGMRPINLGVPGYSLRQTVEALRLHVERGDHPPIAHAFVVVYIGNDLHWDDFDTNHEVHPDGYLIGRGRLCGRACQGWLLRSEVGLLAYRSWKQLAARPAPSFTYGPIYTADFYHSSLFAIRVKDPLLRLRAIRDLHGLAMTVVLAPQAEQASSELSDLPNRMLARLLTQLGLAVVDLLPVLRTAEGDHEPYYGLGPGAHFSPAGHRRVADRLVREVKASSIDAVPPP